MYIILDVETTGLPIRINGMMADYKNNKNYDPARMVQMSWKVLDENFNTLTTKDFIIQRRGFDIKNSHIHGITNEISDSGEKLKNVILAFYKDLIDCDLIVAHNIDFDINVILNHCYRIKAQKVIDIILLKNKYCTMKKSKNILKIKGFNSSYKFPKLSELYNYYFKKEIENAHNSAYDVEACAECFKKMFNS